MYVFNLKRSKHKPVPKEIEYYMDRLISEPVVYLPNGDISRRLGHYARELREKELLHISFDRALKESVAALKINNYLKPNAIQKQRGRDIKYIFEDTLIPKIEIPEIF